MGGFNTLIEEVLSYYGNFSILVVHLAFNIVVHLAFEMKIEPEMRIF